MKIGILSGTFDPIHKGHLWLAEAALEELDLDKVIFMPEPQPRNKVPEASFTQRKEMILLAIKNQPKMELISITDSAHSVIGTLEVIDKHFPKLSELWLVMGADVFEHIPNWDNLKILLKKTNIFVGLRSEDDGESAMEVKQSLGCKMRMIPSELYGLSSNIIRKALASAHKEPEGLSPEVESYIRRHKLYM